MLKLNICVFNVLMNSLPIEIIVLISIKLKDSDIINLLTTNKLYYDSIFKCNYFWKQLYDSYFDISDDENSKYVDWKSSYLKTGTLLVSFGYPNFYGYKNINYVEEYNNPYYEIPGRYKKAFFISAGIIVALDFNCNVYKFLLGGGEKIETTFIMADIVKIQRTINYQHNIILILYDINGYAYFMDIDYNIIKFGNIKTNRIELVLCKKYYQLNGYYIDDDMNLINFEFFMKTGDIKFNSKIIGPIIDLFSKYGIKKDGSIFFLKTLKNTPLSKIKVKKVQEHDDHDRSNTLLLITMDDDLISLNVDNLDISKANIRAKYLLLGDHILGSDNLVYHIDYASKSILVLNEPVIHYSDYYDPYTPILSKLYITRNIVSF